MSPISWLCSVFRSPRVDVILDVDFKDGAFFLAIRNIGDAPAHRIRCKFDRRLGAVGGETAINDLALFNRLAFLAPRKEISTLLDSAASYFKRDEPLQFSVSIEFHDDRGRRHERSIEHDLTVYRDILIRID